MRYLTNMYDPGKEDAQVYIVCSPGETVEQAWKHQQEYLKGKIIGAPQATASYTVEELVGMGIVGVYAPE